MLFMVALEPKLAASQLLQRHSNPWRQVSLEVTCAFIRGGLEKTICMKLEGSYRPSCV
jgi:hypothetical protein